MAPKIPTVRLNSGFDMPIFGLGTWKSKPGEVTLAVKNAIDVGYRHIDCAMVYENEPEVGEALKAKFEEGVVKRDDLFITSKLWCSFHKRQSVVPALRKTLKDLGLLYVDMYLIHWPFAFQEDQGLFPKDPNGKFLFNDVDYVETWKGMEDALKMGLTRSIGISNFNRDQIERILKLTDVVPATNQIEVHPYLGNSKLVDYCQQQGIAITGYSPLGSPDRPWAKPDDPKLLDDELLIAVGKKYNKSAAQVVLRWAVQRQIITIPKSVHKSRLEENINIFDFTLTEEDMKYLGTFERKGRTGNMEFCKGDKNYPFHTEF